MIFSDGRPIYSQIMEFIIQEILLEKIKPGEKVMAVRELAMELSTNPNTVQRALQELERLEILYSIRGRGRFVTDNQQILTALKEEKKNEVVKDYLQKMANIGLSTDEAIREIQRFIEVKHNDND
ncbi:GntR family transcriptional regulator [Enterococcus saccharolyticus]|uniref:GntR family transcriptional regulator n=1 Tax=Candidatus Enterococcus willemsii TaxID=1857215 RepID=A0ABQ6Z1X5_9ENTE|nr:MULTISPECIES: GntR family transcriptional regulator [Enterococcus]KAF1305518.1 GntR family transcriptional regulator [Enterococcus sp. CU12B]MCD5002724.1 GntR family transcriptional regulator [Enterococcus saccharolyticus]